MVIFGGILGAILVKFTTVTPNGIELILYPGELMMRLLKVIVMPLIVTSVITGLAGMDPKTSGKLGGRAICYYLTTTFFAAVFGMVLVSISKPGTYAIKTACNGTIDANGTVCSPEDEPNKSTFDTILDLGRNIVPDNIVASTFEIYVTELTSDDDGNVEKLRTHVKSVNVLGLGKPTVLIV